MGPTQQPEDHLPGLKFGTELDQLSYALPTSLGWPADTLGPHAIA
jgi:hypothetical protein